MAENIYKVTNVTLEELESFPLQIRITAKGEARTEGWCGAELSARQYVTPPEDGIYEYNFIAEAPTGTVQQVITEINAKDYTDVMPEGLKGIKVIAETNDLVKQR